MKRKPKFDFDMGENKRKIIIFAVILALILITAYFNFFSSGKCQDIECFNSMLARCKKVEFLNKRDDANWLYVIKGASKDKCMVTVKNLWVNIEEAKGIEGKSMTCYLPRNVVIQPESDLSECHGLLKEALQDVLIERLHTYIVQNIGQISEEIKTPL